MTTTSVRATLIAVFLSLIAFGCDGSTSRSVGLYKIVEATDGFFGFVCQSRTEFYFVDPSSRDREPAYLGTCGTPRFITEQVHMPGDPSCFAIAADGLSLVYFHLPGLCGAGKRAEQKPGGVYRHSVATGDRLIYGDRLVSQMWGGATLSGDSIRISWISRTPSKGGAICGQEIILSADENEIVEGWPDEKCLLERKY